MSFKSMGDFIAAAEKLGDVKTVHGADLDLDVGCLTEIAYEEDGPMLLFDRFKGYPDDFRVVTNVFRNSIRRYSLALGFPTNAHPVELVKLLRERRRVQKMIPPLVVADGPVLENQWKGSEIDIDKFPVPKWHSGDGGRYIGTGDLVIVRDPETDWINFGTYRSCVQGKDRVSLWINKHKHGRIIAEKYWIKGQACPVAVVVGCDPVTFMASTSRMKYEYAGALHGAPVEVVKGPYTGLPIPAHGEIVLEGEIPSPQEESVAEGPFGEWPGYYSHSCQECVVRVKQIVYRNSPMLFGDPPMRPLLSWGGDLPAAGAEVWDHLERSGVTDITGVWGHCRGLMMVISLKPRYAGHAMQALFAANGLKGSRSMSSFFVAVDDDIDPANFKDVLWAICTRADPGTSVEILKSVWTEDLDPRLTPTQKETGAYTAGRILIDACKPFHWRDSFPKTNIFPPEDKQAVKKRWAQLVDEMANSRKAYGQ
jgi:UbiD family decarboxylase